MSICCTSSSSWQAAVRNDSLRTANLARPADRRRCRLLIVGVIIHPLIVRLMRPLIEIDIRPIVEERQDLSKKG